jgi:hypothetical protein
MNVRSLKLAGAAAGLLIIVGLAPNVFAQTTEVLTFGTETDYGRDQTITSTFTFTKSMILNSIGFVTTNISFPNAVPELLSYTLKGGVSVPVSLISLSPIENGVRWLSLASPVTMNVNDVVTVSTLGQYYPEYIDPDPAGFFNSPAYNITIIKGFTSINSSVNVSVNHDIPPGGAGYAIFSNGNLRVSNPGSNVAPEPGSIALLLTGGGALAGIALRRRRNAG